LPQGAQIHLDFFGEPISFFGVENGGNIESTVAALDRFEIGLVTKGKAFTGTFFRCKLCSVEFCIWLPHCAASLYFHCLTTIYRGR